MSFDLRRQKATGNQSIFGLSREQQQDMCLEIDFILMNLGLDHRDKVIEHIQALRELIRKAGIQTESK